MNPNNAPIPLESNLAPVFRPRVIKRLSPSRICGRRSCKVLA